LFLGHNFSTINVRKPIKASKDPDFSLVGVSNKKLELKSSI